MAGYICPYCLNDSDGPVGPEGCAKCDELEDKAFEQVQSGYWEELFETETTDILDVEDLL